MTWVQYQHYTQNLKIFRGHRIHIEILRERSRKAGARCSSGQPFRSLALECFRLEHAVLRSAYRMETFPNRPFSSLRLSKRHAITRSPSMKNVGHEKNFISRSCSRKILESARLPSLRGNTKSEFRASITIQNTCKNK